MAPGDEPDRPQEDGVTAFAFFKPRPMITDLTKGGMGDVARKMCPSCPPKPVGQLDRCTTGLMIFTTNGRLTCHLNAHVAKSYRAWYEGWICSDGRCNGELTDVQLTDLLAGIELSRDDGRARFESVERCEGEEMDPVRLPSGELLRKFLYSAVVSIRCGKFHVVKRLFSSVGKGVVRLQRLSVAGLTLESLGLSEPGEFLELSSEQCELLWDRCPCRQGLPLGSKRDSSQIAPDEVSGPVGDGESGETTDGK
ncbi:unnamed protein product, partial [Polarella glacialis]